MSAKVGRMLRAALAYVERGWRVLPLRPGGKEPLGRLVPHGCKDASSTGDDVLRWWSDEPEAGVAIATGSVSGIWVLDIDGPVGAVVWWQWEANHGHVHTLAQRTGRIDGGRQLFFQWPDGHIVKPGAGVLPGIDVRGDGGYVVAPPSIHPSGRRYQWEGKVELASASDALLKMVGATHVPKKRTGLSSKPGSGRTTPYGKKAIDECESDLSHCGRGGRDRLAFKVALRLLELELGGELAPGETEGVMRRALRKNGYLSDQRRGRGEAGLHRILKSASDRAQPKGAP